MSDKNQKTPWWARISRTRLGLSITVVYVVFVCLMYHWSESQLHEMALNEFGDYFAGVFGPMALLWLILGYLQQGEELQQNTEALRMQHQELVNTLAEHKEQTQIAKRALEEQREQFKSEILAQWKAAQPQLAVTAQCMDGARGKWRWKISVACMVNTCTRLNITLQPELWTSETVVHIELGTTLAFVVSLAEELKETQISVNYYDVRGNTASQKYDGIISPGYWPKMEITASTDEAHRS